MYGNKLKILRENKELTQTNLGNLLGITKEGYGQYEREYVIIPIKHLISLCNFFNVSLDYIFSFTDKSLNSEFKDVNLIEAGKRLKEFRKEQNITQEKLSKYLNTNRSLLSNYEKGIYLISTPFLYMICKKYKVSADYLLGRIDNPKYLKNII